SPGRAGVPDRGRTRPGSSPVRPRPSVPAASPDRADPYRDTAARASGRVNRSAYSALPTIAPSTPMSASPAIARRSTSRETPPEASTGALASPHTSRSSPSFGPARAPSLLTSVKTEREQPSASSRASASHSSPPSDAQTRPRRRHSPLIFF